MDPITVANAVVMPLGTIIVLTAGTAPEGETPETVALTRVSFEDRFPADKRGIRIGHLLDGVEDDQPLVEARYSIDGLSLIGPEKQYDLDLSQLDSADVEFAWAALHRMNADGKARLDGPPPDRHAQIEILFTLLDSEDADTVRMGIVEAEASRDLIVDALLGVVDDLTPEFAADSSLPALACYLLARFREPRALEPIVHYFETCDEDGIDAFGDVVTEDLPSILASLHHGNLEPIVRLMRNQDASSWSRGAAAEALVISVAQGLVPVETVEDAFDEALRELPWKRSEDWTSFALSAVNLGSWRLFPTFRKAFDDGLIDTTMIGFDEFKEDVAIGQQAVIKRYRHDPRSGLIDDVVAATSWWELFDPPPLEIVPKAGRNEPCPCGSGKKYKKCCGA